ncbi:hypothetical protein [Priestia megaterium]|uniref:hypothetical protein n=1 Tax=Priestia megaterium TaxID=1404 RepID=UPI0009909138|nr:hypothetical protein [Priestia megaterium]AQU77054.1 hypothetical protein BUW91_28000 [Priestia megaterium]
MQTSPVTPSGRNAISVYYDNIKKIINKVIDDESVNRYSLQLGLNDKDIFESVITRLVEIVEDIEQAESNNAEIFNDFDPIEYNFKELHDKFPDFINEIGYFYTIFFSICRKVSELDAAQLQALVISNSNFILVPIQIGVNKFVYTNRNIDETVVLISLDNVEDFSESLNEVATGTLLHLLDTIDYTALPPSSGKYCFVSNTFATKDIQLKSFIELNKVAAGEEVHTPHNYTNGPSITSNISWNIVHGYHQFSDVIYILSEYNHQKNILDKYLKIYQVIENFMYKLPICAIVNGNGDMFSIRHFKSLYDKIANKEIDALQKFNRTIFDEEYQPGTSFKDFIFNKWNSFANDPTDPTKCNLIDTGLEKIGVGLRCNKINRGNLPAFFADLVYKMRNSIVHNKETEFHITYGNISNFPGIQYLLEGFLLASMEEIVYNLIINKNPNVSYLHPNLKLFED